METICETHIKILHFVLPLSLSFHADTIPLKPLWVSHESIYKYIPLKTTISTYLIEWASRQAAEGQ